MTPARTSLAVGLAVLLTAPLLGAAAASAAPAPGEVLHMIGYDDETISAFDSATNTFTKVGTIPDSDVSGGDFNPVTRLVYYIAETDDDVYTLTSLDPVTNDIIAVVPLSGVDESDDFQDLDITSDGTARVLLDDDRLGTVNLSTGAVTDLRPVLGELNGNGLASSSAGVLYMVNFDGNIYTLAGTGTGYAPTLVSESVNSFGQNWVADFDSNDVLWFDSYEPNGLWSFDSATPAVPATRVTTLSDDAGALYFVTPPALPLAAELSVSTIVAGGHVTVTGENFTPDGDVRIELHSDPVVLGTTKADAAGTVSFVATIPASTLAADHTIHLFDVLADTSTSVPLTVTAVPTPTQTPTPTPTPAPTDTPTPAPTDTPTAAPAPGTGSGTTTPVTAELASTGTNAVDGILTGGAAALLLGLGLLVAARRRHARA
ncbi:hypothetical protein GCM10022381_00020 [Leifsonia kafniensis]|uniref:Gram-positive cocci surface proteins LPxTG domain-containing protein n=2 Tax=Leifsonia kafniensis TaxID=475957 RepID=A0ABP7K0N2_9MICO